MSTPQLSEANKKGVAPVVVVKKSMNIVYSARAQQRLTKHQIFSLTTQFYFYSNSWKQQFHGSKTYMHIRILKYH